MPVRILALIVVLLVPLPPIGIARAREYQFSEITDTVSERPDAYRTAPEIDAAGDVTYSRDTLSGPTISRRLAATGSTIDLFPAGALNDPAPPLSVFINAFDSDDSGNVALLATGQRPFETEVFSAQSGVVQKVAASAPWQNVAISGSGLVVFADQMGGIYTSVDPAHSFVPLIPNTEKTVSVNDAGQIAFLGSGTHLDIIDADGTLHSTEGPAEIDALLAGAFDFNEAGDMAFIGVHYDTEIGGDGWAGAFTLRNGVFNLIADTRGAFYPDGQPTVAINNLGDVAIQGQLDTGQTGIFTGGDPIADKVIETGDALAGSIVVDIVFGHGINDARQIAFWAQLADGREGIFRADPVDISLAGDANLDGLVDGADYTTWADHFLMTGQTWQTGDFNGDGLVDGADYTIWADNFAPAQLSLSAVPEPSTLALSAIGVLVFAVTAAHRRFT